MFCQPIQFGGHHCQPDGAHPLAAFDTAPLHPYSWQGDEYAEVDLTASSSAWAPVAAPQLAFEWDFNAPDPLTAFAPAAKQLAFAVEARASTVNAVAFWFELALDDHTRLTSSPYARQAGQPATTWKQVRQRAVAVVRGLQRGGCIHDRGSHAAAAVAVACWRDVAGCAAAA